MLNSSARNSDRLEMDGRKRVKNGLNVVQARMDDVQALTERGKPAVYSCRYQTHFLQNDSYSILVRHC